MKEEFINRYKYLYDNAEFLLTPYFCKRVTVDPNKEFYWIAELPNDLLLKIESFLLSDIPYDNSELHDYIEKEKNNKDYLRLSKEGLKYKKEFINKNYYIALDLKKLLFIMHNFLQYQVADYNNRTLKLNALEEYFKLDRYDNTGVIIKTGVMTNNRNNSNNDKFYDELMDDSKKFNDYRKSSQINTYMNKTRTEQDTGLIPGKFVRYLNDIENKYNDNNSVLTEIEKQDIYLCYHEEIPCNLMIDCELEDKYNDDLYDMRLIRPNNTKPCGSLFNIKEDEIFTNFNDSMYRYYQICPHCGYIVNIPKEIIPGEVKQRIEKRCRLDPKLFRKSYLFSELYSIDRNSETGEKTFTKKLIR